MRFLKGDIVKHRNINTSSPYSFGDYLKQMRPLFRNALNSFTKVRFFVGAKMLERKKEISEML